MHAHDGPKLAKSVLRSEYILRGAFVTATTIRTHGDTPPKEEDLRLEFFCCDHVSADVIWIMDSWLSQVSTPSPFLVDSDHVQSGT